MSNRRFFITVVLLATSNFVFFVTASWIGGNVTWSVVGRWALGMTVAIPCVIGILWFPNRWLREWWSRRKQRREPHHPC